MARFGHPLKASHKSPAAAFEGLWTAKPSAAACEGVPLALPWYLPRPHKLFLFGLRNCYVARFGHPLKASKAPQQLSKAFEPQNPPQQLAKASPPALPWYLPRPHKLFLLGFGNCYVARFGTLLKAPKAPQQLSKAFEPQNPLQQLVPPALPWYLPRPHKLFSIGLRNCYVARFGHPSKASKAPQQLSKAFETAKPSAAACEGVPPALPWYLPRPHKLFLLGFETATWHVLGTP